MTFRPKTTEQIRRAGRPRSQEKAVRYLRLLVVWLVLISATRAQTAPEALIVTPGFAGKESVAPGEVIELRLNRSLKPEEGKPAVLIGQTDVTNLLTLSETTLAYLPTPTPLPLGETTITIFLIAPDDEWKEIAKFPLRVVAPNSEQPVTNGDANNTAAPAQAEARRRFGFDKFDFVPSLTLGFKSQFAETHFPETNKPARPTFADATLQGSLKTEITRGALTMQSQYDLVGSSFQQEALRFGTLAGRAPQIDLASYLMQFQHGERKFFIGHTSYGSQRHLISNFGSRGLTVTFPLGKRTDFALAAMNSTSIIGWNNFFGMDNRRHELFSGSFGFEFIPERRGGLRVEAGLLDAWFQPRNNFNQGAVNDTERSQGVSARALFADKSDRAKLEAGFTRSRFTNPEDPLLAQGASVVAVRQTTRNARYVDASYDLFRELALTSVRKLNFTINFKHERVDPLFRSIPASVLADRLQNSAEATGVFGEVNFNYSHTRFNDNLANIPSILKSLTRRDAFAINAPLNTLLSKDPAQPRSSLLPRVGFTYDRTHQFAGNAPVDGGFNDPSTIPDQVSLNQSFTAEWSVKQLRIAYRLNHSLQDNRQIGRGESDLVNLTSGVTIGWNPLTTLEINFDLNAESARNNETKRIDRTLRFGAGANWQMSQRMTLNANFATIGVGDVARTSDSRNLEFDAQWSYRLTRESASRFQKFQVNYFVRYARRYARALDRLLGVDNLTKLQTLNTGLNFVFF
jgi:hypothetical protein